MSLALNLTLKLTESRAHRGRCLRLLLKSSRSTPQRPRKSATACNAQATRNRGQFSPQSSPCTSVHVYKYNAASPTSKLRRISAFQSARLEGVQVESQAIKFQAITRSLIGFCVNSLQRTLIWASGWRWGSAKRRSHFCCSKVSDRWSCKGKIAKQALFKVKSFILSPHPCC